jgi:hypothetical protein
VTVNVMSFSSFRQAREPTNSDQPKWSGVDQWQMGTMTVRADHLLIHTGLHPYAFLYLSLSLFMMATGG